MPATSSRAKKGAEQPRVPCELPWSDLTEDEQSHAKKLSFERTTWGDNPHEGEKNGHEEDWTKVPWTWAKLKGKEKQAAEALGFTKESWKGGVVNVTDAATTPEPQQKSATPIALDSVRRCLFAEPTPEDEPIIVPEEPAKTVDTVMAPLTEALMKLTESQMDDRAGFGLRRAHRRRQGGDPGFGGG